MSLKLRTNEETAGGYLVVLITVVGVTVAGRMHGLLPVSIIIRGQCL